MTLMVPYILHTVLYVETVQYVHIYDTDYLFRSFLFSLRST